MRFGILVVVAAVLGTAAAIASPAPDAQASTVFVDVFVHEGGNKYLTCGWHGSSGCGSGSGALDWDNADNAAVWWRSWVLLSSSSTPAGAVDARPVDATGTCYAVRVDTYDNNALLQGNVKYTHTDRKTGNFNVLGKDLGLWDTHKVGKSVATEKAGCPFGGSHVHMASSYGTHNHSTPSYYPTDSTCELFVVETDCGTKGSAHAYHYHFFQEDWSY